MSFQAMSWALAQRCGAPGPKLVLLCLANYADEHGICWPSDTLLADEVEVSSRSVVKYRQTLRDRGLITWDQRRRADGSLSSNRYRLIMTRTPPEDPSGGGTEEPSGGGTEGSAPGTEGSAPGDEGSAPGDEGSAQQEEPVIDPAIEPRGGDSVSNPTSARDQDPPPDAHSAPTAPPGSHVEGTPPSPDPTADLPDIPPARCPDHIDTPGDVPPCRACADARRAHDAAVAAHERARAARTALIDRDRHTELQRQMLAAERTAYRPTKGHLRRLRRQHRADAGPQALADMEHADV
jgi:hypothetical protein